MLAVGMSFGFTVFCMFSCYRGWITRDVGEHKQLNMAVAQVLWAFFYDSFMFMVLWAGHSTKNEVVFHQFERSV